MSKDYVILNGDCLEQLKTLPANSIDSLVTDPPAGISFMGKAWDDDKGGSDVGMPSSNETRCSRTGLGYPSHLALDGDCA